MFNSGKGNDQKGKKSPGMSSGVQSTNSLVQGTTVEGTIRTDSDIRIDGKVMGKVFCKGKVILGPTGEIQGDIDCQNALIEGHFNGNIVVHEILQIKETANVQGEVETKKLIVQSGSVFNVTCRMGGQKMTSRDSKTSDPRELDKLSKVAQSA